MTTRKAHTRSNKLLEKVDDVSVTQSSGTQQDVQISPASSSKLKPASQPKKQQLLFVHTSVNRSVPGGGRGSANKRDPATAGNGKAPVWYHRHWQAVDQDQYPGSVYDSAELRRRLKADNVMMQCLYCEHQRKYDPCTSKHIWLRHVWHSKSRQPSTVLIARR